MSDESKVSKARTDANSERSEIQDRALSTNFKNTLPVKIGMIVVGIDEAGRGPIIGPMVVAGVAIDDKDEQKLIELGVKDSKLLSPRQRESMFDKIKKIAKDHKIIIIPPSEIDEAINSANLNLNKLENIKYAMITNYLKPEKVILDCPSNNIIEFVKFFEMNLTIENLDVVAEHKADVTYPVVSAASILAKVTRDREIEKIKKQLGVNFGSGYPADPITAEFVKKNYDKYPDIMRKTWETYKRVVSNKNQRGLKDFK